MLQTRAGAIDEISLEVAWNRLVSIADEGASALYRASVSVMIGEVFDFSVAITDLSGESVAFPRKSMPLFNGSVSLTMKEILRHFPLESMQPEDTFMCNDPWVASGHLPDVFLASPVFHRGRIIGFAASIGHVPDIGGTLKKVGATEVFEEGLRIPPCRFLAAGQENRDVVQFIRYNVRVPEAVLNDFHAQIGAHRVMERRLRELLDDLGLADPSPLFGEVLRRSEEAMRAAVRRLPQGPHGAWAMTDGFLDPLLIKVTTTPAPDGTLTVDFTGSSPQCRDGSVNSPYACTFSEAVSMVHTVLLPHVPANSGCFRPIRVVAPKGSVFNAQPPAAVNTRTRAVFPADNVIMAALARAAPDRVMAGPGHPGGYQVHGHYQGKPFITFFMQGGGMGGSAHGPGVSCLFFPGTMSASPVEVLEQHGPLVVSAKRILPESGGQGRYRGGCGQEVQVRLRPGFEGKVTVSMHPHMLEFPAQGLFGGAPGEVGKILLNGERLDKYRLNRLGGAVQIGAGDLLIIHTPGGGGYGTKEE